MGKRLIALDELLFKELHYNISMVPTPIELYILYNNCFESVFILNFLTSRINITVIYSNCAVNDALKKVLMCTLNSKFGMHFIFNSPNHFL